MFFNGQNMVASSSDFQVKQVEGSLGASTGDKDDDSNTNTAIIAGAVCGGLVVIVLLILVGVWVHVTS